MEASSFLYWRLDDRIDDPWDDCVDVRFELNDETRWMTFVTPRFLERQLPNTGEPCWVQQHLAIVLFLDSDSIEKSLKFLFSEGLIIKHSVALQHEY